MLDNITWLKIYQMARYVYDWEDISFEIEDIRFF